MRYLFFNLIFEHPLRVLTVQPIIQKRNPHHRSEVRKNPFPAVMRDFLSADPKVRFKSEGHAAQVAVHEDAVKGFEIELPGTLGAELDDEEV